MYTNELYHYGIPGMKWGVKRNYNQNSQKQLSKSDNHQQKRDLRQVNKANSKAHRKGYDYDHLATKTKGQILNPNSTYAFNTKRKEAFILDSKIASKPIKSIKADDSMRRAIDVTNKYIEKYGDVKISTINYIDTNNKIRTKWKYE